MSAAVESMAWVGEVPWHGLGVEVSPDLSPEEMLKVSGLDWNAVKRPLRFDDGQGGSKLTGTYALVRDKDNKILSNSVSKNWEPIQNKQAFEFFSEFCESGEMKMETAGSLSGGKFVFGLARIQESFMLPGRDRVDAFLLFSNPHLVGNSINIMFTPIRVVCANTLAMALDGASTARFRHIHTAKFDPEEAKLALGLAKGNLKEFRNVAEFLTKKRYTPENLEQYFKTLFPTSNDDQSDDAMPGFSRRAALCAANVDAQPGAEMSEGSWWQAFNTVTFAGDHLFSRTNDTRLKNSWFGWMRQKKMEALDLAVKMAEAA